MEPIHIKMENSMDSGGVVDYLDYDPNFEPQFRVRSNTWPSRPREVVKSEDERSTPNSADGDTHDNIVNDVSSSREALGINKVKSSSRRNAWGNLSYADLITKAVETSPDKRLTLSQIYDWMVQNVPYFKDKGDTNSSAGWKNSIRHNLSLHSRFMRIQNEGTGKSSWWVINPDAKPGKTPRRRATSMDTKAFEKKRGRVKKKLEQLRAAGIDPSSKLAAEYGDSDIVHVVDHFNLSPQDFRARTSSNASSIGGRLSPIQSMYESDLHDNQLPPMSPLPWNQTSSYSNDGFTETLSESLAEMFVGDTLSPNNLDPGMGRSTMSTPSPLQHQSSPSGSYLPPPPLYTDQMRSSPQVSPNPGSMLDDSGLSSGLSPGGLDRSLGSPNMGQVDSTSDMMGVGDICLQDRMLNQSLSDLLRDSPPGSADSSVNHLFNKPAYQNGGGINVMSQVPQHTSNMGLNNSLLRQALTEKQQLARSQLQAALQNQHQRQLIQARLKQLQQQQQLRQMQQQQYQQQQMMQFQQQQQFQQPQQQQANTGSIQQCHLMAGGMVQEGNPPNPDMSTNSMEASGNIYPGDLELVTINEGASEDLQCDIDQIIRHELSMDGLLDFNFDSGGDSGTVQT